MSYREKIVGCWLGKAVGGTLGMPYEGQDGPLSLTYYDPVPTKMEPNDDLDLQVVWACVLAAMKSPAVNRDILAAAWLEHVGFPFDEYGVALRNMRRGIKPPYSGSVDNWFAHGMGAAIRSELWACLAPGNPQRAAAFAYEDACVDHAGEGIWAEVYLAVLESMAFDGGDVRTLCRSALEAIPADSLLRRALQDTLEWADEPTAGPEVNRARILSRYEHENFTDVLMNLCFIVLGVLAGEKDFGKGICTAVNCGKDTDCTGATVGSILGILNPNAIPDKWLRPIGRSLVLSPAIKGIQAPPTLDAFTNMVLDLKHRLNGFTPVATKEGAPAPSPIPVEAGWVSLADGMPAKHEPAPEYGEKVADMQLEGTWARFPRDFFRAAQWLMLRYRFELDRDQDVRLMVSTPEGCRVWLDNEFSFGRDGGVMAPAFHRALPNQFSDHRLSAGTHEIVLALRPVSGRDPVEWVVGVADVATKQWLTNAFI